MRRLPASRIPAVAPDNHRGAVLATEHLIGKGHRRLAFLGGFTDMVVYHERLGGFREACAAHGIAADDIVVVEGETNRRGGMAALDTALAAARAADRRGLLQRCRRLRRHDLRCASAGWSPARISPSSASTTSSRPSTTCRR